MCTNRYGLYQLKLLCLKKHYPVFQWDSDLKEFQQTIFSYINVYQLYIDFPAATGKDTFKHQFKIPFYLVLHRYYRQRKFKYKI